MFPHYSFQNTITSLFHTTVTCQRILQERNLNCALCLGDPKHFELCSFSNRVQIINYPSREGDNKTKKQSGISLVVVYLTLSTFHTILLINIMLDDSVKSFRNIITSVPNVFLSFSFLQVLHFCFMSCTDHCFKTIVMVMLSITCLKGLMTMFVVKQFQEQIFENVLNLVVSCLFVYMCVFRNYDLFLTYRTVN